MSLLELNIPPSVIAARKSGKFGRLAFRWPLQTAIIAALFAMSSAAQPPPPLAISSFPTGLRPMGMVFTYIPLSGFDSGPRAARAVVANSGDNSVSFFGLTAVPPRTGLTLISVLTGIPSPYAVAACPRFPSGGPVLVTSPSDNSVRVLGAPREGSGVVIGRIQTGLQPHSVACSNVLLGNINLGVVSNVGDSTLTVFDPANLAVKSTIAGVPGSRGLHGIAITGETSPRAWVAGTAANVVTEVDLVNFRVLTQIPVSKPTAVVASISGAIIYVASADSNSITGYDGDTLRAVQFQSVINPQDFVLSPLLGNFAISDQDSLWRFEFNSLPGTASPVVSIPGATTLAAPFFSPGILTDPCCALVLATRTSTNSVYLIQPAPGPPAQFIISNGASFATGQLAPGSLGSALVSTGVSESINASFFAAPLPKMLAGVTLKIGGSLNFNTSTGVWEYSPAGSIEAPLHFVGPNQINFQVPTGIALGDSVPAQLTKPDGTKLLTTLQITATAPGVFTVLMNGQGQGAVLNDDSSPNGLPQLIPGAKLARRGSVVQIFATGAGETDPPLLPGEPAPASGPAAGNFVLTRAQPSITISGRLPARVLFSGMAPGWVGLWQINAEVPLDVTPGQAVPLKINLGRSESNTFTIAVQ